MTFFYNNHYTKYVDQVQVWFLDLCNQTRHMG